MKPKQHLCFQLLQEATNRGLYEALVNQLQKDFDRANVQVDFIGAPTPEKVLEGLHEKIYQLIMERFTDYLNVLYVVDVPEHAFKEIPLTDVVDVASEVCYLILEREWRKLLTKQEYKD